MPNANSRRIRLACVGHAAVDHAFQVLAFPAQPVKTPAQAYSVRGGGMSFNAAIAAARLGAEVRLLGRVGEDAAAQYLRQCLQAEGIEARGLRSVAAASTSVSAIIVNACGERYIFNHRGSALTSDSALDVAQLEGADALLVDPRWMAGAVRALRWAHARRLLSVLDADIAPRADLARLVPLVQWAVFSQAGLAAYAPGLDQAAALGQALSAGCQVAMVTLGADGVRWRRADGPMQQGPAPAIRARDTTAAGDVFHGALALALAEGRDEPQAVAWACAAAALKCQRGDGVRGAPTRAQLSAFVKARACAR